MPARKTAFKNAPAGICVCTTRIGLKMMGWWVMSKSHCLLMACSATAMQGSSAIMMRCTGCSGEPARRPTLSQDSARVSGTRFCRAEWMSFTVGTVSGAGKKKGTPCGVYLVWDFAHGRWSAGLQGLFAGLWCALHRRMKTCVRGHLPADTVVGPPGLEPGTYRL